MQLRRGGLDGDGLGCAPGGRRLGLSLLLHRVVVRHTSVGHLGLTLSHTHKLKITSKFIVQSGLGLVSHHTVSDGRTRTDLMTR